MGLSAKPLSLPLPRFMLITSLANIPHTAPIDPRLLPLIETLISSGADWLAFEILEGIRAGRPAEDSEEEIKAARLAVRSFRRHRASPPELKIRETVLEPIAGDEQINFAAQYLIERISAAIDMERASLQQLDQVVAWSKRSLEAPADSGRDSSVTIRLEDSDIVSNQNQAEEALKRLPDLRKALFEWAQSVRKGSREE